MTFNEYQSHTAHLAFYPQPDITYTVLGLCGEAGEVAEKHKKRLRDGTFDKVAMLKELGDVLWYVQACAMELGSSLEEVAEMNIEKLRQRQERGTQRGSGDDR